MNRNSIWDNMIFYSEVRSLMVEVGELVMFAKAALVMFMILVGMHILKMGWQLFGQKCCKCKSKNTEEKM